MAKLLLIINVNDNKLYSCIKIKTKLLRRPKIMIPVNPQMHLEGKLIPLRRLNSQKSLTNLA